MPPRRLRWGRHTIPTFWPSALCVASGRIWRKHGPGMKRPGNWARPKARAGLRRCWRTGSWRQNGSGSPAAETVIESEPKDVLADTHVARPVALGDAAEAGVVHEQIFQLARQGAGDDEFDAGARRPVEGEVDVGAEGLADDVGREIADRQAAGLVGQEAIDRQAEPQARGGDPIALELAVRRTGGGRNGEIELAPAEIKFLADHERSQVLRIVADGAADEPRRAGDGAGGEIRVRRPFGIAPGGAAAEADIEPGPVIDRWQVA